jgi:hypothetical protein
MKNNGMDWVGSVTGSLEFSDFAAPCFKIYGYSK